MCFSTEASFTAALVLGVAGGLTLKNTTSKSQFFIAAIPLLFAIQQFSEGLIWLYLGKHIGTHEMFIHAQLSFLTFAFLIWPIWIPLSFFMIEPIKWKRIALLILLSFGIALSFLNLTYAMREDISISIVNHSIQYSGHVPEQMITYPLITLLPMFISSLRNIWIYGLLTLLAFIAANYFYTATFTSVWCFFSAVISIMIYKILKDNLTDIEKGSFEEIK